MDETTGVLRPAVEAYLCKQALTATEIATLRAYFRQWINAPAWAGPMIGVLRTEVEAIATRADIERWLDRAISEGVDPL